ncbi:Phosphatidylinositol-binding clathrin assembly protein LAP [Fasciola gigantica]|uniref:Phosphatidylinositol-binding clathrin assembly protein LAP n=1 Tax=Fasciola gigantica TaxID=46835 RepID=A0A504Z4N4_FASGI|nr:Phosphatidylinositol-binding clathrin assembly protein LAP [Fasciola gigantica]
MAFDFCKVKRGRDDGVLRTMPIDKLLKALPVLALQITTLLEFDAHEKDLNNTIINAAFLLLYKDLVRLFASYNEGMINLIEKYFTLKLNECRLGMELYHNFPGILDKITEFLTLAESLGIGDKDSLGLQPVPEKVIHAMEQHLAILESKKGSDDEDDTNIDHPTPSRPTPPKKPTVTVPLPVTKPTVSKPKSAGHQPADLIVPVPEKTPTAGTSTVDTVERDIKTSKPEADAGGEDDDQHAAYPTVVVNDEEGLPSTLQEEIIAAATSHLAETIDRSNEAVKRSAKQTTISPIHTQLGRYFDIHILDGRYPDVLPSSQFAKADWQPLDNDCSDVLTKMISQKVKVSLVYGFRSEHRTIPVHSGPPSRSRSPSPGRPVSRPMTIPTHEIVNSASDTDLKAHAPAPNLSSGGGSSYQNLSVHGLNEATDEDGGASPICGSPFEGDEKIVEPATGVEDWPEAADEPQSKFDAQFGTPNQNAAKPPALTQTTTGSSVMDDLLGLDLLASGPDDTTPIPVPTPIAPTTSVTPTSASIPSVGAANDTSTSALILDDLLSLDPLMGAMDPVPPPTIPATTTQILGADGSINLPPGLKQVNPNMPIRPVAPAAPASKNALDSLDSTLMNLASSLGGQQGWGSSQTKKRPISGTSKLQVSERVSDDPTFALLVINGMDPHIV